MSDKRTNGPCSACGDGDVAMNYHNHDRARIGDERDAEIEAIAERYIGSGDNIAIRRVGLADTITALVANRVGEERGRFKSACRIHTAWTIGRYLMSNAEGLDGAEDKKWVYCFGLFPAETWGRKDLGDQHNRIPAAVFDFFHSDGMVERIMTSWEWLTYRNELESFGLIPREITRWPYHEPETIQ